MRARRRGRTVVSRAAGFAVAAALTVSGCTSTGQGPDLTGTAGFDEATTDVVAPSDARGGTLRLVSAAPLDSVDPGNTYLGFAWNFSRLYARTLVTFRDAPGANGLELVPDLATSLGEFNDDGTSITYTLREGLAYEDGTAVTSMDVKYAIERSNYAPDVLANGPRYFAQLLGTDYAGPYDDREDGDADGGDADGGNADGGDADGGDGDGGDGDADGGEGDPGTADAIAGPVGDPGGSGAPATAADAGLRSIRTPDSRTIVFDLTVPFAEFDYLATLPQTSPVPERADTGADYARHPLATGPYRVDFNDPGRLLILTRNPGWRPDVDPLREQLPDRIEVTFVSGINDVDRMLLSGAADLDLTGRGLAAAGRARTQSTPNLRKNIDNPLTGFLRYAAVNTAVEPLDDVHCRRAVLLAVDHAGAQRAFGGPAEGRPATNVLPPSVIGYEPTDRYDFGAHPGGDLAAAREQLRACGRPEGFQTVIAAREDRPKEVAGAQELQRSLARVDITADVRTFPSERYFSDFAGDTDYARDNDLGLILSSWAGDWPTGYAFLQQLVDGRGLRPSGNANLSRLDDPEISTLLDSGRAELDADRRADIWARVDEKVMDDAAILPIVDEKALLYRGPRVTNVFVHPAYGMYSYLPLGIRAPAGS